jgi:predicted Zn-dependent protease
VLTADELAAHLDRASASLDEGNLAQAESACRAVLTGQPNNPAALHMLGLIRVRGGDAGAGEELLRRSVELEPGDARLRLNLATFLRRAGRLPEAERVYRRVLQLAPRERAARHGLALTLDNLGQAREAETQCRALVEQDRSRADGWGALGFVLANQNRLLEAEAAYRHGLSVASGSALLHRRLGLLLVRMDRAEEALAALARAQSLGARGFEMQFARGRALNQLNRLEEAEQAFTAAVSLEPRHADAQLYLARAREARGDPDFTRSLAAAARAAPGDIGLQQVLVALLLRAERGDVAEELLRAQLRRAGPVPHVRWLLSQVLRESGRLVEAETEALEAAAALPEDPAVIENVVSVLLSRGRPEDALPFIRAQRARTPESQGWLAYEATAARLRGQPLYRELYDYERFVRCYELQPPPGFASLAQLNAALLAVLATRLRAESRELGDSLRNGRQTARNLVMDPDPLLRALLRAFDEPLHTYLEAIGRDAAHPFTARNQGAVQIAGAWAVRLERGGFHVNHFHNGSWISATYYVAVPEEADDENLRSGWLKLGEPRFATPGAVPGCFVPPRAGHLVLYPSYMWHGTNVIRGSQPRIALSFDALPQAGA